MTAGNDYVTLGGNRLDVSNLDPDLEAWLDVNSTPGSGSYLYTNQDTPSAEDYDNCGYETTGTQGTYESYEVVSGGLLGWKQLQVDDAMPNGASALYSLGRYNGASCVYDLGSDYVNMDMSSGSADISGINPANTALCFKVFMSAESLYTNEAPKLEAFRLTYESTESPSFTFEVLVDKPLPEGQTTIDNTICIDTDSPEIDPNNNCSNDTIKVRITELSVKKDVDQASSLMGSNLTYTLNWQVDGPEDAINAQITDVLPVGVEYTCYSSGETNCTGSGSIGDPYVLTWELGDQSVGASGTITIPVMISTQMSTIVAVELSTATDDAKEDGDGDVRTDNSSEMLGYYNHPDWEARGGIAFHFTGVGLAQNAVISSAKIRLSAYSTQGGGLADGLVISAVAADNPDGYTQANDTYEISASTRTSNTVTWIPGTWTSGTEYYTEDISTIIQELVDRGGWTSNNAMNIIIDDPTPVAGEYRRFYNRGQGASTTYLYPQLEIAYVISTNLNGEYLQNTVCISNDRQESDYDNNCDDAGTYVGTLPNLWIEKSGPGVMGLGQTNVFTLEYGNNGNTNAPDAQITDALPEGLTFVSSTPVGPTSNTGSPEVLSWDLGDLAVGATGTIQVTVLVGTNVDLISSNLENEACISTSTNEVDISDNCDQEDPPVELLYLAGLSGYVWHDDDRDVVMDDGESPLEGIQVVLNGTNLFGDSITLTNYTLQDGSYNFPGLYPGSYTVTETQPEGWMSTGIDVGHLNSTNNPEEGTSNTGPPENIAYITIAAKDQSIQNNFGEDLGRIGDRVWFDWDNDGIQEGNETTGVSNVTVRLYDASTNEVGVSVTDAQGNYIFEDLTGGTYYVRFDLSTATNYTVSPQNQGGDDAVDSDGDTNSGWTTAITLTNGQDDLSWDLGLYKALSIGDRVWFDDDADGIQDTNETVGVSNVTVRLYDATNGLVGTTMTDTNGLYIFTNLPAGTYHVELDPPSGYEISPQDQGSDNAVNSDINTNGVMTNTVLTTDDMSWDAGLYLPASIGNYVWEDQDKDGLQDAGEPGIGNVTVTLYNATGGVEATTSTDSNGLYSFTNLAPGVYHVEVATPTGYTVTASNQGGDDLVDSDINSLGVMSSTTLISGENDPSWDAGFYYGICEGGEGELILDGSGDYVSFGTFTPNAETISIWVNTKANNSSTSIYAGSDAYSGGSWDWALYSPYVRNGGTYANIGNYLDQWVHYVMVRNDGGVFKMYKDGVEIMSSAAMASSVVTAGRYLRIGKAGGVYYNGSIDEVMIFDDVLTSNEVASLYALDRADYTGDTNNLVAYYTFDEGDFSDSAGSNDGTAEGDAHIEGEEVCTYLTSIGDLVWLDEDADGIQDTNETTVFSNVTVTLYDTNNSVVASTSTDTNGLYLFTNLPPADYYVALSPPGGYGISPKDQGTNDTLDSDIDSNGVMETTTLTNNENDLSWDAGLYLPASIGDKVWEDEDADGEQDIGEPGISNVVVKLYEGTNEIGSTTTDTNGMYSFTNLVPGTNYHVEVVPPTGWAISPPNTTNDTIDSDIDTNGVMSTTTLTNNEEDLSWDAGLYQPASIGDLVWLDVDVDGVQDTNEVGLCCVTVRLYNATGGVYATTTTDVSGVYSFSNLPPASYHVEITPPDGYVVSPKNMGGDPELDSDIDPDGVMTNTVLVSGENDPSWDAGLSIFDLALIKSLVTTGTVVSGDQVEFLVQVINQGQVTATNISLVDYIPDRLVLVTTNGWTEPTSGQAVNTIAGPLTNGAYTNISIFFTVEDDFSGVALNYAEITAAWDPNGNPVSEDVDSPYDNSNQNTETNVVDDVVDNSDGDEDDHDVASLTVLEPDTTYALIEHFSVRADDDGLLLQWETSGEYGAAGFELWRRESSGEWTQVSGLLPALGLSAQGGIYRYLDRKAKVKTAYAYRIMEHTVRGRLRLHGPFEGTISVSTAARASSGDTEVTSLQSDGTYSWGEKEGPVSSAGKISKRSVASRPPDEGIPPTQLKLKISESGLYALSASELATAFAKTQVEIEERLLANAFRVTSQGREIATLQSEEGLRFFGEELLTRYTEQNVYWVTLESGTLISTRAAGQVSVPPGQSWMHSLSFEEHHHHRPDLVDDPEQEFIFWYQLYSGLPPNFSHTFDVASSASGTAAITVRLQGALPNSPNRQALIRLNGIQLGIVPVPNLDAVEEILECSAAILSETGNKLEIDIQNAPFFDRFYVDRFTLSYPRYYEAENNALLCESGGHSALSISGFGSSQIAVYDISDAALPVQLTNLNVEVFNGKYMLSFAENGSTETRKYLAVTDDALRTPLIEGSVPREPALRDYGNQADWLIIAPSDWVDTAQQLVDYRRDKGLISDVIDLVDIFDEFNYGIRDPRAIRAFLGYAYRMWERSPRYVVLAGAGSYDYHNKLGSSCIIPPMLIGTAHGLSVSDTHMADLDGDGSAELAIGRLPITSAQQMLTIFDKITAHESGGAWKNKALTVSDTIDQSAGDFPADSASLAAHWAPGEVSTLSLMTQSAEEIKTEMLNGLNAGKGLVTYYGHASMRTLGKNVTLFAESDLSALNNANTAPLWLSMTCLTGQQGKPDAPSLGKSLLTSTSGGAAGVLATGGQALHQGASTLAEEIVLHLLSGETPRIGDALLASGKKLAAKGFSNTAGSYTYLGDPAMAWGDAQSPRGGQYRPADVAQIEEWLRWRVAPVLADQGLSMDLSADLDGDGFSLQEEYVANTDPHEKESLLRISKIHWLSNDRVQIDWSSQRNVIYKLESLLKLDGVETFEECTQDLPSTPKQNSTVLDMQDSNRVFFRVRAKR